MNSSSINSTKTINENSNKVENDDEDDDNGSAVDMSLFLEECHSEEDPNLFVFKSNLDTETNIPADFDEELLHTRTYDLHITYDKYYQVCFLFNEIIAYNKKN